MEKERKVEDTFGLLAAAFGIGLMLSVITGCSGLNVHAGFNVVDEVKHEEKTHSLSFMERVKGSLQGLRSKGGSND